MTVHRLPMATVKLAGAFNPPSYQDTRISVYAYAITGIGAGAVLVDTGIGDDNPYIDERFEPERTDVQAALALAGLEPRDVTVVINSHLHFDHCGNNRCFPDADVVVQRRELEAARNLERYTVRAWFDHAQARIRPVSGDVEIVPGIRCISTPGHTPGHQSVLVTDGVERILIAAQAAFTAHEFQRGGDPAEQAHEGMADDYLASIRRLESLRPHRILFSHDCRAVTPATGPGP